MIYKSAAWFFRLTLIGLALFALISYNQLSLYFLGKEIHGFYQHALAAVVVWLIFTLAIAIHFALNRALRRSLESGLKAIEERAAEESPEVKLEIAMERDGEKSRKTIEINSSNNFLMATGFTIYATVLYTITLYLLSLILPGNITLWGFAPTLLCGLMLACAWVIPRVVIPHRANK